MGLLVFKKRIFNLNLMPLESQVTKTYDSETVKTAFCVGFLIGMAIYALFITLVQLLTP